MKKISDIAKKVQMPTKKLREAILELKINVPPKTQTVSDELAQRIIESIREQRRKKWRQKEGIKEEVTEDIKEKRVALPPFLSVKELSDKLQLPVTKVISELIKNGVMATINEEVDFETASIIAEDLGYVVIADKKAGDLAGALDLSKKIKEELKEGEKTELVSRPPIVTILGHVDHGKTTLLDAIRETNVTASEHGGITQHIGAYQVKVNDKPITFLDTPGHEAFASMRSRGAKVTDIAILIVAADDGVRPQTIEALEHAKKAGVPIIVAVNKIDKPGANIDKVKQQLGDYDLVPEEWGGKTVFAEVSAKQKKGINELLDMILLVAEMENLISNPKSKAVGTVIESNINPTEGALATVLIQNGTLSKGSVVIVGETHGTIKAIKNYAGETIDEASPSTPARVLGLNKVPAVGDILREVEDLSEVKELLAKQKQSRLRKRWQKKKSEQKKLNMIIKTDVQGSLEAITESLAKLESEDLAVQILGSGAGAVNESDITMALNTAALVIGFNTTITPVAEDLAREKSVAYKSFNVIYELIDFVKKELDKLFVPEVKQVKTGELQILAIFRTEKDKMIVGGKVNSGKITAGEKVKVIRAGEQIGKGSIDNLQLSHSNVKEVGHGNECGLLFKGGTRIKEGDVLETWREEIVPR